MSKLFSKSLCKNCTLEADCCCRQESQEAVAMCGMESVESRTFGRHSQTYNNPDYAVYMDERFPAKPTPIDIDGNPY